MLGVNQKILPFSGSKWMNEVDQMDERWIGNVLDKRKASKWIALIKGDSFHTRIDRKKKD